MARPRKETVAKATMGDTPERFKLSESGYLGLNIYAGVTDTELKKELNFPASIQV